MRNDLEGGSTYLFREEIAIYVVQVKFLTDDLLADFVGPI